MVVLYEVKMLLNDYSHYSYYSYYSCVWVTHVVAIGNNWHSRWKRIHRLVVYDTVNSNG
jgi:hypothetical protein